MNKLAELIVDDVDGVKRQSKAKITRIQYDETRVMKEKEWKCTLCGSMPWRAGDKPGDKCTGKYIRRKGEKIWRNGCGLNYADEVISVRDTEMTLLKSSAGLVDNMTTFGKKPRF